MPKTILYLPHLLFLLLSATGCASLSNRTAPDTQDALFVVHGVDGSGPWYNDLVEGLRDGGITSHIEIVEWGGPLLVLPNLQLPAVHKDAEATLTKRLTLWHNAHPTGRISLIGHSAGCGVILGTLATLPADFQVNEVLLLAPAVSKTYNLAPALSHVRGTMYVFYSDKDQALLNLGTSVAGTYDGVWGKSAGLTGFTSATTLPTDLQPRFQQIPYNPEFDKFGHNGDHFGYRKRKFARQYLAPLVLTRPAPSAGLPWSAGTRSRSSARDLSRALCPNGASRLNPGQGYSRSPGSSRTIMSSALKGHDSPRQPPIATRVAHPSSGGCSTRQSCLRPDTPSTPDNKELLPCVISM